MIKKQYYCYYHVCFVLLSVYHNVRLKCEGMIMDHAQLHDSRMHIKRVWLHTAPPTLGSL